MTTSWGSLAVKIYLVGSVYAMGFAAMGPVIPRLRVELGLSNAVLGTLFTAVLMGFLVASVLSGALRERTGWKRAFVGSGAVMVSGITLFPLVRSFPFLVASAAMIGLGGGVIQPLSASMLAALFPGREGTVVNMSQVYFGVGAVFAPVLVRLGVIAGDWRWAFLAVATFGWGSLLAMSISAFPDASPRPGRQGSSGQSEELPGGGATRLASASFVALAFAMFLYTATEISFWGWLPTYLQEDLHATGMVSGLSVAIFWAVFIGVRLVVGRATSRFGELRVIQYTTAASVVVIAGFYLVSSPAAALAAGGLVALFLAPIWPTLVAYTSIRFRNTSTTALGIVIGAGGLGGAVGPPLLALVAESVGMKLGFVLLSLPAILILSCVWWSGRSQAHR